MGKQAKIAICALLLAAPVLLYSFIAKKDTVRALSEAKTEAGKVSGVLNSSGDITSFKGIPFAAPPVGDLRWKAPQPVKHWDGVKKCDAFGPSPMQAKPTPFMVYTSEFLIPEQPISEDCLYLNVWTGAKNNSEKRGVFVYIYGGGFTSGGSACAIYDGEAMAKKGIIFVSINYRVGVFGFYANPELTKESNGMASGNYGLLDQVAALKWVKNNIAAFGGDPDNVTICGQSAGSMSVNALVASPLAKGLFNKAIAESGSLTVKNPAIPATTLQSAEEQGTKLADKVGAKSLADLRAIPAEEVLKKFQGRFSPIVDGYVLPESIPDIFAQNKQNHVPLITGWNGDESFVMGFKNSADYRKQVAKEYGADSAAFLKYFPGNTDEEAARSQILISRNQIFALSGYNWANMQSQYSDSPVYVYNFDRKVPATGEYVKWGAFHTAEVPYVMDNLKTLQNRPLEPVDYKLSDMMCDYWVNFVKTGNPNGKGLRQWPKYNTTDNQVMVFDATSKVEKVPGKGGLDFMLSKAEGK
ncbi:MAG TPA: carboxylesterase family protein [Mucilaginibacter sp.]|nr:carboxylesterase family protein [Mucilaginibacter sp.]